MELRNKATKINLFDFNSVQMRTFHLTWLAFHLCFFGWFGVAPLMALIREDLDLTKGEIGWASTASVAVTILVRLIIGPLCDKVGPRRTYGWLLMVGSVPVALVGLANSFESFLFARLCIGAIGASFVITQYHTSVMFAPNVVGTANATTAGWGNLGGGMTQMVMPWVLAAISFFGVSETMGWRLSMIVPGIVLFLFGLVYLRYTQDCPDGDYRELRERGRLQKAENEYSAWNSFKHVCKDYRVWAMFLVYGACFGVELTLYNFAALYFHDTFNLGLAAAGFIAFLFGFMNIFARTLGGVASDLFARSSGLRGRVWWLFIALIGEGLLMMLFSQMTALYLAVAAMVVFSVFVMMAEGATFGLVPFMDKKRLGAVAGIVGAGGNMGAVVWSSTLFTSEALTYAEGFFYLGVIIVAISFLSFAIRFEPATLQAEDEALARSLRGEDASSPAAAQASA
ncbi:NarK family nitrate/nitrite MFS transporter [Ectothiorhodospiraceae bacterium WFHF3C12]|nr:NarK family nitrate/nitrite MFS transporter [Ectothiorhodospiraceae bacterium WFHF3C12]